jgi:hypothetical protein
MWFKFFAVVARVRFGLPMAAPVGPVQHLPSRGLSRARVATRNAAASMARVMWAYQAS